MAASVAVAAPAVHAATATDSVLPSAGDIGEYYVANGSGGTGLVQGADGNLWSSGGGNGYIYDYSPSTGSVVAKYTAPSTVQDVISGPRSSMWFAQELGGAQQNLSAIGQITASGAMAQYPLPAGDGGLITGVAADSAGNVWFTSDGPGSDNQLGYVGYLAPDNTITQFPMPLRFASLSTDDIVAGPDGNMWFIGYLGGGNGTAPSVAVGSVTPAGVTSVHALPYTHAAGPSGITVGADGNLWFSYSVDVDQQTQYIVGSMSPTGGTQGTYLLPADFAQTSGVAEGRDGNVYVAGLNATSRVTAIAVSTTGKLAVFLGTNALSSGSITATTDGDIWLGNGSGLQELTVTKPDSTQLTLSPDANPSYYGQTGNIVADLAPDQSGAPAPTGTVQFFERTSGGDQPLGSAPVANGTASLPLAAFPFEPNPPDPLIATYSGDANYGPETSIQLEQTVKASSTTTALTSSANPSVSGGDVTVTATVAGQGGGVPPDHSAEVVFTVDGNTQNVMLTGGSATLDLPSLAVGSHSIEADFPGLYPYGSSKATLTQVVTASDPCPCTVFPDSAVPTTPDSNDAGSGVELGVKIRAATAGNITGVRFYKSAANTGTHTGSLWTSSGTLLATGTFADETATGWQTLTFADPVPVKANTTYVASYHAPNGHYSSDGAYFAGVTAGTGPITALADGTDGGDGAYAYGSASMFPAYSYNASNYWVDAVFDAAGIPTAPPTVTATTPSASASSVASTSAVTVAFSAPIDRSSLAFTLTDATGATVPATVTYDDASRTATLTPSTQLPFATGFTASVQTADAWGHAMSAAFTWSFTTGTAPPSTSCPCSLFSADAVPAVTDAGDGNSVELGVRFTSAVDGTVTGVRFYKGSQNAGTHTGSLWASDGTLLATGTFTEETATGWQTLTFADPVTITAGTTYVASYHAPAGHYSYDYGFFDYSHIAYPLTALSGNGVYAYNDTSTFPDQDGNDTNYWVDPVFSPR